jgi:hypothetical protein
MRHIDFKCSEQNDASVAAKEYVLCVLMKISGGSNQVKVRTRMEFLQGISTDGHGFPWDPTFVSLVSQGNSPGKDGVTVKYIQKRLILSWGSKTLYCLTVTQVDMSGK